MCERLPCPPCPPPPQPPCPQVCPPCPPLPECRHKPIMRGLHWTRTKSNLATAILLSIIGGASYDQFVARPRREAYREFYRKSEFEDWADEMARRGVFQSVPRESITDFAHMHKKS